MALSTPGDLRKRIALAVGAHRNGLASDGQGWFRDDAGMAECYALADALLPVFQADRKAARVEILAEAKAAVESAQERAKVGGGLGWETARDVLHLLIQRAGGR